MSRREIEREKECRLLKYINENKASELNGIECGRRNINLATFTEKMNIESEQLCVLTVVLL